MRSVLPSRSLLVLLIALVGLGPASATTFASADMVLHRGDFDFVDDPVAWDAEINAALGASFPYIASVGTHDVAKGGSYQQKLIERLSRIPDATCVDDYRVKAACSWQGPFFMLSGAGMYAVELRRDVNSTQGPATITITSPVQDATVPSGPLVTQFSVQDFVIGDVGQPHLHFYIDSDPIPYEFYNASNCDAEGTCVQYQGVHTHFSHWQGASSIAILGLSSQQHTVRFALVDSTHTELTNPEAASTLTFTVAQPPTGEFTLDLVADGLNFPVRMAATPAGRLFYNEMNSGQIRVLDANFSLLPQPFYSGLPRSN